MMFDTNQPNYSRLRSIISERTDPVVLWIGAGINISSGMPTWAQLKDMLCEELKNKINGISEIEKKTHLQGQYDLIVKERNNWLAFQHLKRELGETSYTACVKQAFSLAPRCEIPVIYDSLFNLNPSGIITLNIDRICTRAYSKKHPGDNFNEFTGIKCGAYIHLLKSSKPFIVNLHGDHEDRSSWIFTKAELNYLHSDTGYSQFIKSILNTRTVIFLGIRVDDLAVGGHLERLHHDNIDFGSHFWITDRTDYSTDRWAENAGLLTIKYNSSINHDDLRQMIVDISGYHPTETVANPVISASISEEKTKDLSFDDLELMTEEELRIYLNRKAKEILITESIEVYKDYNDFCEKYDKYIYRCWYVTDKPPSNVILGYRIEQIISEGAFAHVYRALDGDNNTVALKLLKNDVRRRVEMLQSFRRGVQAMKILEKHHVEGMIPYIDSSEIPAITVMEYVEGPNLAEAVQRGYCSEWSEILDIATRICSIVRSGHQLPERVLHRDIRPANIMLKGYYGDPSNYQVVVLDFDLSWYVGSQNVSILSTSTMNGYLAPEQVERDEKITTRSAAVDSFGIGMTLYFLRTGLDPIYMEHKHANWTEKVYKNIESNKCSTWYSVPIRYARIVEKATIHIQSKRMDCSTILLELQKLRQSESNPEDYTSAEMISEEIIYRVCMELELRHKYLWNDNKGAASIMLESGVLLECAANEKEKNITLIIRWANPGRADYKNVRKYLDVKCDNAISNLKSVGWQMLSGPRKAIDWVEFTMNIDNDQAVKSMQKISSCLCNIVQEFRFD